MNVQTFVPGKFLAIQFPIALIFFSNRVSLRYYSRIPTLKYDDRRFSGPGQV
jgi:hypothetical protein